MESPPRTFNSGEFLIPTNYRNLSLSEGIYEMLKEVDWTEPFLLALGAFHVTVTLLVLLTRHHGNVQAVLFGLLIMLVYGAQSLNKLGARYWRSFSNQQYFDSSGLFISFTFSVPLLLNCIVMIGHWMWISAKLMSNLRVKMLETRSRQQAKAAKSD